MAQKSDKPLEPIVRRASSKKKNEQAPNSNNKPHKKNESAPAAEKKQSSKIIDRTDEKKEVPQKKEKKREQPPAKKQKKPVNKKTPEITKAADIQKESQKPREIKESQLKADFMTFENATSDDFAALLSGETKLPETRRFRIGDEVTGTIVTLGHEYIYLDLGAPYEGIAKTAEFEDEEGKLPFETGDQVKLFVVDLRGGTISLGMRLDTTGAAIDTLENAFTSGLPVEGTVVAANKGGFVVKVGDVDTFCPISQIELGFTEDPNTHVGQTYEFKVTDIREEGRNIVVSRASLLQEIAKKEQRKLIENLKNTKLVSGKVSRLADFGAFVEIAPGIEGLLHISEIGYAHIDHPKEALKEGDSLDLEVLSVEELKGGRLKISLSLKNTLTDPWESIYDRFSIGTEINGTVVRTEPFGAFVEIAPGIEGLVHVSEISWSKRISHASDVVADGDTVFVRVLEIDPQRRRISLSMKSLEADPWKEVETTLSVGDELTGVVERVEDFGAFIRIEKPAITALLPRSEMDLARNETPYSKLSKDAELTARILDIDLDRRRMALTLKSADEVASMNPSSKDKKKNTSNTTTSYSEPGTGGSGLGTFADLLRDHLKK